MRLTAHNGRASKGAAFSEKHNDRNFDIRHASHIDAEKVGQNRTWHIYHAESPDMTFEEAEKLFYERHFQKALDERNERQIANGHAGRVRTMDDYRHSIKTCPEEQIMMVGCKGNTIDAEDLWKVCAEQLGWEQRHFPNFRVLDVSLHLDEEGAPHVHKRGVWVAHDDEGREIVGQNKALKEMGVEAPDPDRAPDRFNNPKVTYTRECREHFMELCLERGWSMETEPREASKSGLNLEQFKTQQEQERQQALQQEQERLTQQNAQIEQEMILARENTLKEKEALKRALDEREAVEKETADMMTEKEFSKELFSSKQIDKIEVKERAFHKDEVIISRADFDKLTKTAAASKNLLKEVKPARETLSNAERLLDKAKREAETLIAGARDKASYIEEHSAKIQLEEVARDFPEYFKGGVYQGKERFSDFGERTRDLDDDLDLDR